MVRLVVRRLKKTLFRSTCAVVFNSFLGRRLFGDAETPGNKPGGFETTGTETAPIVSGTQVGAGYFAKINQVMSNGMTLLCSGAFISPHVVLTAAHCTRNYGFGDVITPTTATQIRYGEGFTQSQPISGDENVGWKELGSTDIGLYRVAQAVPISRFPLLYRDCNTAPMLWKFDSGARFCDVAEEVRQQVDVWGDKLSFVEDEAGGSGGAGGAGGIAAGGGGSGGGGGIGGTAGRGSGGDHSSGGSSGSVGTSGATQGGSGDVTLERAAGAAGKSGRAGAAGKAGAVGFVPDSESSGSSCAVAGRAKPSGGERTALVSLACLLALSLRRLRPRRPKSA